jgi:ankyrin repeat protein
MAPSLAVTPNKCLDTPLHCAAKAGHDNVATVLLSTIRAGGAGEESRLALRMRNQVGATALYEAVRHSRIGVVNLLTTEAPDLSSVATEDGFSPLYLAAMMGSTEMVQALLRPSPKGTSSPASFSGPEGRTALHVAATVSKGTVLPKMPPCSVPPFYIYDEELDSMIIPILSKFRTINPPFTC